MTYAESKNLTPFDFHDFLRRAKLGQVNEEECKLAILKARRWETCACGNKSKDIPREIHGAPKDYVLRNLGWSFASEIMHSLWNAAEANLALIDKREAELLSGRDYFAGQVACGDAAVGQ